MNKIVIGIIGVVLLAGAFFAGKLLDSQDSEEQSKGDVVSATEQYFAMERFIISINDENLTRYLVLDLTLAIPADAQSLTTAQTYTPLLRNELVKIFVNLEREHVKNEFSDIEAMQKTLLEKFNSVLKAKSSLELSNVLITNVFIQ
ncbi:flagellar basal body-associated FliL family protein [Colwellia sp. 20A7]|uniref:flagellar basal body-associated FliL family protein n=1 Tax=Colwellia sp. 20A7 TaxID=2689569 RepID=UPI00135BD925|nr:flagellar basal body-associated FliL family protein [Colwellia sp. 20A7]